MMPSSGALFTGFNRAINAVADSVTTEQARGGTPSREKKMDSDPVAVGATNAGTTAASVVIAGDNSKRIRAKGDGSSSSSSSGDEGEKRDVEKA